MKAENRAGFAIPTCCLISSGVSMSSYDFSTKKSLGSLFCLAASQYVVLKGFFCDVEVLVVPTFGIPKTYKK